MKKDHEDETSKMPIVSGIFYHLGGNFFWHLWWVYNTKLLLYLFSIKICYDDGATRHSAVHVRFSVGTVCFSEKLNTYWMECSSGSRNLSGGGLMTSETCGPVWRPSFFWLVLTGVGGPGPPGSPLDPLLEWQSRPVHGNSHIHHTRRIHTTHRLKSAA